MKLNFIPVTMRLPLKFGAETIHSIQIAHVEFEAYGAVGRGETPLSVGWRGLRTCPLLSGKRSCAISAVSSRKLVCSGIGPHDCRL